MESRIIGGQEAWAHSWPWQVSLRFASMPACGGAIIGPLWVVSAAHCFKSHQTINIWMSPPPPFRRCTITGWGSTRENGPRIHRLQEVNVTILPFDVCNQYYLGRIRPSMFCAGKDEGGADACQGDSGGPLSCFTGSRYELAGVVSWGIGCGRARKPGVYTQVQQHTEWMSTVISDQGIVSADDVTPEEDRCGKQQSSSCRTSPGLAALSVSQDGEASVGNVTESCPFFWPWQVSLQSGRRHYCSGALIHHRWVLTAKHCNVRPKEDVVVLGVHDLRFTSSQTVPVDQVFNPPHDGSFPPKSDLSLLRLSVPTRFSSNVSPVCVPDEDQDLDDSWSCVTTGWGATKATDIDPDRLHHAGLTLLNQTTCMEKWGGGLISDTHICSHPAGSASCMERRCVCRRGGAYFLFGVLTWGSRRCDVNKPAVFTRISDYHSWISEVTEDV
ncbi:Transmembrane protease serine 9 [Collichthys lucidus]|uniref:Transmembrane protease serine 9 n=1 Tax=Collichthys lucidus TaxID=240159 RepID=A0A4U5VPQ4_COLLU|nr:Transmembrane protease serine 9 [Collichthys lucidus]